MAATRHLEIVCFDITALESHAIPHFFLVAGLMSARITNLNPTNTRRWPNAGLMSAKITNLKPNKHQTLAQC